MRDPDPAVGEILSSGDVWDMTLPWLEEQQEMATLARFHRAGFTFVSLSCQDFPPTLEGVQKLVARFTERAAAAADWLVIGSSLADVVHGRRNRKLVVGFNVQDTIQVGTDLARVESLYAFGVRHMLLAYNVRNFAADGCGESADAGLSNFGRRLVREMNAVGMVVDCSHTGRRSTLEAIDLSERPAIFSHSNVYAICRHIRNIRDEQIRACAARGGVIGITGIGAFLGDVEARPETVFRHIDHVASLVGAEHVGLGSDYVRDIAGAWAAVRAQQDTAWPDPTGTQLYEGTCLQPEQLAELVTLMLQHGYSRQSVLGILGGNFRRVYALAEAARAARA